MRPIIGTLMLANAALFCFGALQHAGITFGPLHEPVIGPATIVESICALALISGAAAVLTRSPRAWITALIGNLVAIAGVGIGIVALAAGAGPRSASNDLYHRIMLLLAGAALIAMLAPAGRAALKR